MTLRMPASSVVLTSMIACLLVACGSGPAAPSAPSAQVASSGAPSVPSSAALDQVIEAAKREGTVNWAISPQFHDGVQPLHDLVKSKWGVDLKINANGQLSYSEKVSKTVTEIQAGATPTYDLLDISDSTLSPMLSNKAFQAVDWAKYLPAETPKTAILQDALLVTYDGFLMPAYNPKIVPPEKAPKDYEGLLDPQWKGKISAIDAQSNWSWLAQPSLWGEQRLYDYVQKLYGQRPALDRYAGMLSRLLSGEYPISSGMDSGDVFIAQRKNEPIEPIYVDPIRDGQYGAVIPKGASHPNAAILLALAEVTPEAQAIRDKIQGDTAGWVKGTAASQFVAAHKTVIVDLDFQLKNQARVVKRLDEIAKGAK